jgi:glycosyltransferase involved in cell wall biosynthesis
MYQNSPSSTLVSIIVPFYKVEKYFVECLESVVNQSYKNLEIILIDDCSPDGSLAIARAYAAKDDRISIIRHDVNKGLGGARNTGLAAATGDYIWFIDSDDKILYSRSVESILGQTALHNYPNMIGFGCLNVYEKNRATEACLHMVDGSQLIEGLESIGDYMFELSGLANEHSPLEGYMWHKWFKRDFIVQLESPLLDKTLYEDVFTIFFALKAQRLLVLQEPHYFYRKRIGSITNCAYPSDFDEQAIRLIGQWIAFKEKHLGEHPPLIYWYKVLLSVCHLVSTSWRENLAKKLKDNPEALNNLYEALHKLLVGMPAISEIVKYGPKLNKMYTLEQQELLVQLATTSTPLSSGQQYQLLNGLLGSNKEKLIKKIIKGVLPYALSMYLLKKRGWGVYIYREEKKDVLEDG